MFMTQFIVEFQFINSYAICIFELNKEAQIFIVSSCSITCRLHFARHYEEVKNAASDKINVFKAT